MPTFSLISQPQELAPVNAPLWFVGTSTNNQFPFFKYNFQLYRYNRYNLSERTFLGQFKIPPRPTTNLGVFDAHKVLQSQVGAYNFSYTQSGIVPVEDTNSVVEYKGLFGYEYNPNYPFQNTFSYSYPGGGYLQYGARTTQMYNASGPGSGIIYPKYDDILFDLFSYKPVNGSATYFKFNDGFNTAYYQITSVVYHTTDYFEVQFTPTLSHIVDVLIDYNLTFFYIDTTTYLGLSFSDAGLLKQNDIITILMYDHNFNSSYNGEALVLTELTTHKYITNVIYGLNPTGAETGIINLLQRNSGYTNYAYAFPGTRQYTENNVDFGITKEISNGNWTTNYSGDKQIFINQYETLSLMSLYQFNFNNCYYEVKTYDGNKNLLNTYTATQSVVQFEPFLSNNTLGLSVKYELSTGTKNLQGWTMSGTPINLATASYYSVALINSGFDWSAIFTYSIVPNCSVFPNVRIMFQNRDGGYDYWNFNYDSKWTIDINRTLYTKQLDYNYTIGDRGRTILNIDANVMYSANTDWISESDYNFLQELVTSGDVYVIDEITGNKLPINLEDTQYIQKTANREKIFNLTITYRYAYDLNLQGS